MVSFLEGQTPLVERLKSHGNVLTVRDKALERGGAETEQVTHGHMT